MKKFLLLATIIMVLANNSVSAQDVFDPSDPIVNYDPAHPPTEPGAGVIGKWVRTPRMIGWDVSKFKSYIYNSMAFRLRYPNGFNKSDQTKKYPLILFLHGGGEIAENTDNEFHMLLGARLFQSLIDANLFNGYMFFPQERVVGWEDTYFTRINNIIDSLTKYGNVDPDRIIVMGLSIGGNGTLTYAAGYPKRTASVIPSSPSFVTTFNGLVNRFVHIPVWMASGGLDQNPDPASARSFVNAFQNAGGNIRYSFFPLSDHDSWTPQWNEPYIITAWNNAHKANPLVFFNRTEFCPDSAINVKLGLSPGFYAYEWRKGDTLIATTTDSVATFTNATFVTLNNFHEISINKYGTYSVRFKRTATSDWSIWSPKPAVISPKSVTITPAIQVRGINSKVLPSIDGSTTVPLKLPPNYIEYEWRRVGDDVIVSTDSLYTAPVGQYRAKVKEQFGCSSQFSSIFTVVNAGGSPKPDAAKHLTAFTLSQTSIQLEWSDNANPLSDETAFEVYRSKTSGGPYTLAGITAANVKTFIDKNLSPQTTYFYKIRSVNETGASGLTNEASASTVTDVTAPNAPSNLKVSLTFRTFIELTWNSPSDNVGVYKYDVYINGVKKFTTSDSTYRVNNLQPLQTFNFYVKARDASGNVSPASNQVTGSTVLTGLRYKYYEGVWTVLPNFNTLTPISTGTTPNVDILTPRRPGVNDFYGLVWEGYINITTPGTYKFETNSDDGTRVYWNSFYDPAATPLINNDGIQAPTLVSGTINIPVAGLYPIAITFFEYNNGQLFEFYWTPPGGTRQLIPNSAFTDSYTVPGTVPTAPSNLIATQVAFDRITMSWTDNSSNETGFELYRSTSLTGTYQSIGTITGNTFIDSTLTSSTLYYYKVRAVGTAGESAFAQGQGSTLAPPTAPNAPTALTATVNAGNAIQLNWQDNAANETGFELYRAVNNSGAFRLIATLPASSNSYLDDSLFANITYTYKVRSILTGNISAYSNEASAVTNNNVPKMTRLADVTMRYGTVLTIPLTGSDIDLDDLVFSSPNLPAFATLVPVSNGVANLVLSPKKIHQGSYPIRLIVSDPYLGRDTIRFSLAVNDNNPPTLDPVVNATLNEGATALVNLAAADPENVSFVSFKFTGLPGFASFTKDNTGHGTITLSPGFADAGVYPVTVAADDGSGSIATREFTITVNEKSPAKTWLANIMYQTPGPADPYWNNIVKSSNDVFSLSNLKTSDNVQTNVGVNLTPAWGFSVWTYGMQPAGNNGVYPNAVLRDAAIFYYSFLDTMSLQVTNLDPTKVYNFKFLASSANSNDLGYTVFRIGGQKDSVMMRLNYQKLVKLNQVTPDAAGRVNVKIYRSSGTATGFINAFEFQEIYSDSTAPAKPLNLTITYLPGTGNKVQWRDVAYNEDNYRVFRSGAKEGPYAVLNPDVYNADDSSFLDASAMPSTNYYYYIVGMNSIGNSIHSDTIHILTGNNAPVISTVNNVYVKTTNTVNTDFTVTDDAGDVLTVTGRNLPAFATIQQMGGANYRVVSSPTKDQLGWYYATIVAKDDKGDSTTREIRFTVSDISVDKTVLLNFGSLTKSISAPWNNLLISGGSSRSINNMFDDNLNPTTIDFSNPDNSLSTYDNGFLTGNNSGIVPDSALVSGLASYDTNLKPFKLTGLDPAKTYSVGIISSLNVGDANITTFRATDNVGTQTITINGRYNNTYEGRFNGLRPTPAGEINFNMQSTTPVPGADPIAVLNAMIIQEYSGLLRPINLYAEATSSLGKRKVRLSWTDRSSTETAFEIERATNAAFTGTTVLFTTSVDPSMYIDSSLTLVPGGVYYYRVRALSGGGNSDYGNVAKVIIPESIVYVNFTNHTAAAAPWNNTSKVPVNGDVFANLKNEQNVNTGFGLRMDATNFQEYPDGFSTGNNSGVFPDLVLQTIYYQGANLVSKMRITGLDLSKTYRIGFNASYKWTGPYNISQYTIGNRTVNLNPLFNTSKVVYINDVVPNSNGEIIITITNPSRGSLISGLTIESYTGFTGEPVLSPLNRVQRSGTEMGESEVITRRSEELEIGHVYPNPFDQSLNIDFINPSESGKVNVEIYDLTGRAVYKKNFADMPAGKNTLRLTSMSTTLSPGVYMLRLHVNGKLSKTVKLIKATR